MTRTRSIPALALGILLIAACTPSGSTSVTAGSGTTAAASGAPASNGPAATADAIADVKVLDFELQPSVVTVQGSTLSLVVSNAGPTIHNVTVRDAAGTVLFGTRDLRQGEGETVTHAIAPGTYVLFCSLPGHESLGIKGTLTVTAP